MNSYIMLSVHSVRSVHVKQAQSVRTLCAKKHVHRVHRVHFQGVRGR